MRTLSHHLSAIYTPYVSVAMDFRFFCILIHIRCLLEVCLELPSDSTLPWTPLLLTTCLPLPGRTRDFHPLEVRPCRANKKQTNISLVCKLLLYLTTSKISYLFLILNSSSFILTFSAFVRIINISAVAFVITIGVVIS